MNKSAQVIDLDKLRLTRTEEEITYILNNTPTYIPPSKREWRTVIRDEKFYFNGNEWSSCYSYKVYAVNNGCHEFKVGDRVKLSWVTGTIKKIYGNDNIMLIDDNGVKYFCLPDCLEPEDADPYIRLKDNFITKE